MAELSFTWQLVRGGSKGGSSTVLLQVQGAAGLPVEGRVGFGRQVDCYCRLWWGGRALGATPVVRNTRDPSWDDETFVVDVPDVTDGPEEQQVAVGTSRALLS